MSLRCQNQGVDIRCGYTVSEGQIKGLTGFGAIKWTFDPDVKSLCHATIKIERIEN